MMCWHAAEYVVGVMLQHGALPTNYPDSGRVIVRVSVMPVCALFAMGTEQFCTWPHPLFYVLISGVVSGL